MICRLDSQYIVIKYTSIFVFRQGIEYPSSTLREQF